MTGEKRDLGAAHDGQPVCRCSHGFSCHVCDGCRDHHEPGCTYVSAASSASWDEPMPGPAVTSRDDLRLIECEAEPRHPELFYVHDEDIWHPPPCYLCILHDDTVRLDKERHARHRRWHRWRIVQWLITQAYCSGLAYTGGGRGWGGYGGCNGCVTAWPKFGRGKRPYVLWWARWKWTCLRSGHWPGEYVAGACGKCLPCSECGSTTAGHNEGCSW